MLKSIFRNVLLFFIMVVMLSYVLSHIPRSDIAWLALQVATLARVDTATDESSVTLRAPTVSSAATPLPPTAPSFLVDKIWPPIKRLTLAVTNVRSGPDASFESLGTIPENTEISIIGESGDWYVIAYNGREAFLARWLTDNLPTATTPPPNRTPVTPTATRVRPTQPSFVVSQYASPRTRYTHGVVNLRMGPDTSYDLAGSVAANSRLQVIGESGRWYLLRYNGREVFIAGWLTHDSLPQPAPRQKPVQQQQPAQQQQSQPQQPQYSCNCSKTCGQMSSCREAYFQLNNCGCRRRDGDNDGVPCESICR